MPFLSLSVTNFRNIKNGTTDISFKEVFLIGENGQGKSNILESLYYLSYGSSYRTKSDNEIAAYGNSSFSLRGMYRDEKDSIHSISMYFEDGKKRIVKNAKKIVDRKALINTIPCVLYSHEDMAFVNGEPEKRRFFLDQTLSMHDVTYIDITRQYRKTLKSRNFCLKNKTYNLLETYDVQLAKSGLEIQKKRKNAVFGFNLIFTRLYEQVTGIEDVHLVYKPSWHENSTLTEQDVIHILENKRNIDMQFGTSCYGPHRDKIVFVKDGRNFIQTASTGQRRIAAILLRTAQAEFYKNACGKNPILLLDDVLLELDPEKRQRITSLLPEYDQIFFAFLPEEPYERYKKSNTKEYVIKNGVWYG
jgi:DNA replication and repair protein RecF